MKKLNRTHLCFVVLHIYILILLILLIVFGALNPLIHKGFRALTITKKVLTITKKVLTITKKVLSITFLVP
jgi:hypothetical protein